MGAFTHDAAVDHVVNLRDGRRLGYAVYGDPDGLPILNCHGGLVCRFDVEPCADDFRTLGVSVVSPDRPGIGLSDRWPGHSTADWADDARELLDALGVDRFAVMGWSLGGQYAAAIAARLGDRVTRAAIIAGCPPLDNDATFAQLNTLDRRLARLSTRAAPVARVAFASSAMLARRAPERYANLSAKRSPAPDAAVLRANAEWFGRAVGEAGKDSAGMVDEYRAFVGAWGFRLEDILVPVHVCQGTVDELVPPSWASDIAKAIPNATLTTFDGEGHMIAISHRADIVRGLLAADGSPLDHVCRQACYAVVFHTQPSRFRAWIRNGYTLFSATPAPSAHTCRPRSGQRLGSSYTPRETCPSNTGVCNPMSTTFADLGVPAELVSTLSARGIHTPFAIQTLTIADGCAGRDLCGRAPTGSGKTIAFGIPLVHRLGRAEPKKPTGLVLVPTRELAAQVRGELEWLGRQRKLRVAAVYGGAGYGAQLKALRRGVDVLVACPGRLTDLLERGDVRLDAVEMVVVDEADRMADMGFLPVVQRLLDLTPPARQTLLFSATLDGVVDTLVRRYQREPVRHMLSDTSDEQPRATHLFWSVDPDKRVRLCADVVKLAGPTIVFCKTKRSTDRIARQLEAAGVHTEAIHGNRSQNQRERALAAFANGTVDALVATDVAARGIHVDSVACVVHFDLPNDAKDYMHRSGRTARAGAAGTVVSFVGRQQAREAAPLQRALGMRPGLSAPDRDALTSITPDAVNRRAPVVAHGANPGAGATEARPDATAARGAIKWFDPRKGFGFIERHDGDDLFVHGSAIEGGGNQRLDVGQLVDYEIGPGRKGPQAQNVRLLARV